MNFQDALNAFSAISSDQAVHQSINDGVKQVELLSAMVRRFGLDQRKTNLKLDELTDLLEQLNEHKKLSENLQKQLTVMESDRDRLVRGIMAINDQLEDLYRYYEQKPGDPLYSQISLMWSNIHAVLRALGITLIDESAIPYDPRLHAIEQMARDESIQAGLVLRVLRSGYADHAGVLRKARVIINEAGLPDREDVFDAET